MQVNLLSQAEIDARFTQIIRILQDDKHNLYRFLQISNPTHESTDKILNTMDQTYSSIISGIKKALEHNPNYDYYNKQRIHVRESIHGNFTACMLAAIALEELSEYTKAINLLQTLSHNIPEKFTAMHQEISERISSLVAKDALALLHQHSNETRTTEETSLPPSLLRNSPQNSDDAKKSTEAASSPFEFGW